jgi:hypothetical protein
MPFLVTKTASINSLHQPADVLTTFAAKRRLREKNVAELDQGEDHETRANGT